MPTIKIKNLEKYYPGENGEMTHALTDINMEIRDGEFVCIVGPSGCGKSTLLEIVAGLLEHTAGEVLLDDVPVKGTSRDIGVVFQDASLYPWRTIKKNIAFGMDIAKVPKDERVKRGLSQELPEYQYASFLVQSADKLSNGEPVDLSPYVPKTVTKEMEEDFFTILKERRSVREFTDQEVPDEIIDKVLEAGLWAAHGCNVQSIKYVVVREKNEPGLFKGSDVPGGPVHLVILQDMRCYKANSFTPVRNQLLDAGAAGQNIVLAAHAAGLEGVWLTFPNQEFSDRLRKKFELPDYIRMVTYVDVGYGDQTPHPPLRSSVEDAVLAKY
ncbi:nitroreductase family protein [Muricomes intestini]|uniref:Nitroreductase family protein n=2 Tax=Muricomes intestini TaxID=1796634 RepID=A0A4R3K1B6_9FIRM|nr:nitroreductase family protein [Muricomes intestini]TCS75053.1 nitroreductase family protein [Muricomes intestini]